MNEKRDYFFCYTKGLSDHLQERGFQFITVAQDPKTKRIFSLYEITPELKSAISKYSK